MLDIQTKKKLFVDKTAHEAPVRDISMFESSQDTFVSCGYDCNIKVFDLRKRAAVQKHKQAHPMSTVCVSSCGTFCVAGNLKGDVVSYDFRSMKDPLDIKRVHDSAVVRVAFIPSVSTTSNLAMDSDSNSMYFEPSTPLHKSASPSSSMSRQSNNIDAFAKFVDVCHHRIGAVVEPATPKQRDSWADLLLTAPKVHDFSMDSVLETPNRMSIGGAFRTELRLKRQSRSSINQSISSNVDVEIKVSEYEDQTPKIAQNQIAKPQQLNELRLIPEAVSECDGKLNKKQPERRMPLSENNHSDLMRGRKRRSTFHDSFSMHIKGNSIFIRFEFSRLIKKLIL